MAKKKKKAPKAGKRKAVKAKKASKKTKKAKSKAPKKSAKRKAPAKKKPVARKAAPKKKAAAAPRRNGSEGMSNVVPLAATAFGGAAGAGWGASATAEAGDDE